MIRAILVIISLTACLFAPVRVRGQVNIEQIRSNDVEKGFSTTCSLSLSSRSGNVDLTTLGVDARSDLVRRHTRSFLLVRGDMGWKDNIRFSNEGLVHARYTRHVSGTFDVEIYSQFNYDRSRLLDARFLGGGGIRAGFVDNAQITLAVGSSGMVEHERYRLPAGARHPGEETVTRWSNYINLKALFGPKSSLVWIAYVQPRFDRFKDVRILSEATLAAELNSTLSLSLTARIRYDRYPPDGIKDLDSIVLSGVVINL